MSKQFSYKVTGEYVVALASKLFASEVEERNQGLPPGRFIFHDHQIDRLNGFKFEIFSNEHPPPHFRVSKGGRTANFSIVNFTKLNGHKSFERDEKIMRNWWKENRSILIRTWNEVRPSNCPVGPIEET